MRYLGLALLAAFLVSFGLPSDSHAQQTRFNFSAGPAGPEIVQRGTGLHSQRGTTSRGARRIVAYNGPERPGTIVIKTNERALYYVKPDGKAVRYGVGVGRPGFTFRGTYRISRKAEWPGWTPPPAMRKRQPELPAYMPGGPNNPLGARALYLGSTLYRIHGTNERWSIGQAVSSGCIRMLNDDVIDLYERVRTGARVVVH